MNAIHIAGKSIGPGHPVFIIAEAGSNHNRDMPTARRLIDAAADAGADAVKFQTYSAETLYSKRTPKMSYLKDLTGDGETVWDLIKKVELPREWQQELADYSAGKGLIFLSTPFDERAVDELEEIGVAAYKIASFEIGHLPLIKRAASTGKPMLLSTGMADLGDIEEALEAVYSTGNTSAGLFHCTIGYPPPMAAINLRAMRTMARAFGVPVGFSDHTLGITIPAAATALGACMIEKHFTLDRSLPGPDHPFALEPDELAAMVSAIRDTEAAMGSGVKRHDPTEQEMYDLARRSIVAACSIPAGTVITADMLAVKRPGTGIAPKFLDTVIGRTARTDIPEDEIITWEMV